MLVRQSCTEERTGKRAFGVALTASLPGVLSSEEFRDHPEAIPALERCRKLLGEV